MMIYLVMYHILIPPTAFWRVISSACLYISQDNLSRGQSKHHQTTCYTPSIHHHIISSSLPFSSPLTHSSLLHHLSLPSPFSRMSHPPILSLSPLIVTSASAIDWSLLFLSLASSWFWFPCRVSPPRATVHHPRPHSRSIHPSIHTSFPLSFLLPSCSSDAPPTFRSSSVVVVEYSVWPASIVIPAS